MKDTIYNIIGVLIILNIAPVLAGLSSVYRNHDTFLAGFGLCYLIMLGVAILIAIIYFALKLIAR